MPLPRELFCSLREAPASQAGGDQFESGRVHHLVSVVYRRYDFVLIPICQPYISSKIGPEWPPLTPSDSKELAYFLSIPFICAHLQAGRSLPGLFSFCINSNRSTRCSSLKPKVFASGRCYVTLDQA